MLIIPRCLSDYSASPGRTQEIFLKRTIPLTLGWLLVSKVCKLTSYHDEEYIEPRTNLELRRTFICLASTNVQTRVQKLIKGLLIQEGYRTHRVVVVLGEVRFCCASFNTIFPFKMVSFISILNRAWPTSGSKVVRASGMQIHATSGALFIPDMQKLSISCQWITWLPVVPLPPFKKDPGRAKQKSQGTAGMNFTKPRTSHFFGLCI